MDEYVLIQWPESQEFMEEDWFEDEAILDTEGRLGPSAYFIPKHRIESYGKKQKAKPKIIELLDEEVESLLNGNEVSIFEDEDENIKVIIKIPDTERNLIRKDILERYDNNEYYNLNIIQNSNHENNNR